MRLDLDYPISLRGSEIRTVIVRAPTVDDIENVAPGYISSARLRFETPHEQWVAFLARITELPSEIIGELDAVDFSELSQLAGDALAARVNAERRRLQWRKLRRFRPPRA